MSENTFISLRPAARRSINTILVGINGAGETVCGGFVFQNFLYCYFGKSAFQPLPCFKGAVTSHPFSPCPPLALFSILTASRPCKALQPRKCIQENWLVVKHPIN